MTNCLAEHPDVFMSNVKETEFWKFQDAAERLPEYAKYFEGGQAAKARGEFSVRYLTIPGIPERLSRLLPDVRLLVSLRNPVEQIQSWYWHLKRQGSMQCSLTGKALELADAVRQKPELLLNPSRYFQHLMRWWQHFPRDQLLIVLYDDIQNAPRQVMRQIYEHVGVDPDYIPQSITTKDSTVRAGVSPKSALHDQMHRWTYSLLNYGVYRPLRAIIGSRRAASLNSRLGVRRLMENAFFRRGYSPMSEETRKLVVALCREDVEMLADSLSVDLRHWLQ